MAKTQILGTVSVVPMGDWNSTTTYQKGNYVRYNKATYMAKVANVNVTPGVSTNWQQIWMLCNYDGVAEIASETPLPDTENGAVGQSTAYAREDHQHKMSAIYESASAANTKWQAQEEVNDGLTEGVNEALSDIPLAPEQTGVAITGENTLAGASVSVELASINLVPNPTNLGQDEVLRDFGKNIHLDKVTINFDVTDLVIANQTGNGSIVDFQEEDGTHHYITAQHLGIRGDQSPQTGRFYYTYRPDPETVFSKIIYTNNNTYQSGTLNRCWIVEGDSSVPYTPYIADGTSVNVTACGGNLFDTHATPISASGSFITNVTDTALTISAVSAQTSEYQCFEIKGLQDGDTVTLKANWTKSGENDPCARLWWYYDGTLSNPGIVGSITESGGTLTATLNKPTSDAKLCVLLYVSTDQVPEIGDTATFTNVQLEIGEEATEYAQYESATYPATVGQSVEIVQYDKITNVFTDNAGVTVSAAFKQSTRYELDTKPVSLAGTYAERPTGTYPYVVLYTATDRSGETYRLEANTDGSVSANWVQINGIYQHNIVMSQATGPFFSVTIRSQDNYAYAFSRLIEWFNGKGINAQGKDYSDVAGAFKNDSGVLHIISHMRVNGSGLQVSGVNITTGIVADFTINEVATCTDTVITI